MTQSKKLVGISGTHGTGKTTIIDGLAAKGINCLRRQLSRSVQAALGWDSLKRVEENIASVKLFQESIFQAMISRDELAAHQDVETVVERTPYDLVAYTVTWFDRLGPQNGYPIKTAEDYSWLNNYTLRCYEQVDKYYAGIIVVPPHPDVKFVAEANRADEASRRLVERTIELGLRDHPVNFATIRSLEPTHRIDEAITYVNVFTNPKW